MSGLLTTPEQPYPGALGRLLRREREGQGWSLRDAEARTGISHGYFGQVETRRRLFGVDKLLLVARLFRRPPALLLVHALHERLHELAEGHLTGELAALRAPGCRLELRRADGSLVSWQDLGTGAIGVDLLPGERTLDPGPPPYEPIVD